MEFENWLAFCSIALLATATPGPAALLVSTHSLAFGFKKSMATIAGNVSGLLIMSALSVLGLSAVIVHSAIGFTVIKVLGAIYLMYMGIKLWRGGISMTSPEQSTVEGKNIVQLYVQGMLVALTNPKAIIFTISLFPQFIVAQAPLLVQFSLLVVSFMGLSFVCLALYALLARQIGRGTQRLLPSKLMGRLFGTTFIGAGCYLATVSR